MNATDTTAAPCASCGFSTGYFKRLAKEHFRGKYWPFIGCSLLLALVAAAIGYIPIVGKIASFVLQGVFTMGYIAIAMAVVEGRAPECADAFSGFKNTGRNILAGFLVALFTFLWGLLIIPLFIKPFSYSATFYILRANPGMNPLEAITKSRQLMDGHKWEAFVLGVSFIGWILLSILTLGILMLYVGPYMNVTLAEFYNKLIRDDVSRTAAAEQVAQ